MAVPCTDCAHLLVPAGHLESVGSRACLLASRRQWENILTMCAQGLQQFQESAFSVCMLALSREWENAATAYAHQRPGECHNCPSLWILTRKQNSLTIWTHPPQPESKRSAAVAHAFQPQQVPSCSPPTHPTKVAGGYPIWSYALCYWAMWRVHQRHLSPPLSLENISAFLYPSSQFTPRSANEYPSQII